MAPTGRGAKVHGRTIQGQIAASSVTVMHRSDQVSGETLMRRLLRPRYHGDIERRENGGGEKGHHGVDEVASFGVGW
jgi:hypothetical protein